jgi:glucose-6-phosphate 1-epimerase
MNAVELDDLNAKWGVRDRLTFKMSPLGGPVATMSGPAGSAVVALQGAQLLGWTPSGHRPVIWLSPVERLGTVKALRGGTPVCWPWFAAHPADPTKPMHGFVRTRIWAVRAAAVTADGVWVEFGQRSTPADLALWPHQAAVTLRVTLASQLGLTLTTTNTGAAQFALTQALHTYFHVGDIGAITVAGFDGESYQDKLADFARRQQSGVVRFAGEVDRIYDRHAGEATIVDERLQRRITIAQSGGRSAVVWNPGPDKAARLGDLGPGTGNQGGWREFVCVETANAGDDVIQLNAGASHTLSARYTVSPGV